MRDLRSYSSSTLQLQRPFDLVLELVIELLHERRGSVVSDVARHPKPPALTCDEGVLFAGLPWVAPSAVGGVAAAGLAAAAAPAVDPASNAVFAAGLAADRVIIGRYPHLTQLEQPSTRPNSCPSTMATAAGYSGIRFGSTIATWARASERRHSSLEALVSAKRRPCK